MGLHSKIRKKKESWGKNIKKFGLLKKFTYHEKWMKNSSTLYPYCLVGILKLII